MTKIDMALKTLRKGKWVSRDALVKALGDTDLRAVRRLRENGYTIDVRSNDGVYQYKRV